MTLKSIHNLEDLRVELIQLKEDRDLLTQQMIAQRELEMNLCDKVRQAKKELAEATDKLVLMMREDDDLEGMITMAENRISDAERLRRKLKGGEVSNEL